MSRSACVTHRGRAAGEALTHRMRWEAGEEEEGRGPEGSRKGQLASFLCTPGGAGSPAGVRATPDTTCQTDCLEHDTCLHNL